MKYKKRPQIKMLTEEERKSDLNYDLIMDIVRNRMPETRRNAFGDIIYSKQYIGDEVFEYWVTYDEFKRPVKYKDSRNHYWCCDYNTKGNIMYFEDNSGYNETYRYYAKNLVICNTNQGEKIKKRVVSKKFITRDIFVQSEDFVSKKEN